MADSHDCGLGRTCSPQCARRYAQSAKLGSDRLAGSEADDHDPAGIRDERGRLTDSDMSAQADHDPTSQQSRSTQPPCALHGPFPACDVTSRLRPRLPVGSPGQIAPGGTGPLVRPSENRVPADAPRVAVTPMCLAQKRAQQHRPEDPSGRCWPDNIASFGQHYTFGPIRPRLEGVALDPGISEPRNVALARQYAELTLPGQVWLQRCCTGCC
jgi:hypothetical protein